MSRKEIKTRIRETKKQLKKTKDICKEISLKEDLETLKFLLITAR